MEKALNHALVVTPDPTLALGTCRREVLDTVQKSTHSLLQMRTPPGTIQYSAIRLRLIFTHSGELAT